MSTEVVIKHFKGVVNMTAGQIEKWLETDESQAVGQKVDDDSESTGHHSGRRIVEILRKKQSEYSEEDISQMRRVTSYVQRHTAQRPKGDITHTHWHYSLLNWGHEPEKE